MGKKILVVEDERNIVDILTFNLQREGYDTLEALDGAAGLRATSFSRVVFPALGGDTIMPRCPLPMGLTRSITLMATLLPGVSSLMRSSGKMGVISSKALRLDASSMV